MGFVDDVIHGGENILSSLGQDIQNVVAPQQQPMQSPVPPPQQPIPQQVPPPPEPQQQPNFVANLLSGVSNWMNTPVQSQVPQGPSVAQQIPQAVGNFYQQQVASPTGFLNPSSMLQTLAGKDNPNAQGISAPNPDFRKQDIWQQLGQAGQNVVNTIGGAYGGQPIGELAQEVPEVFNGIGAAQRAIQGYLGGSILNALSDPKHNVGQALIPNQTNVIFGLGGGLHGAGEPVEQSFPTNIANLDVKSPEYSEYRDRVANAISDNIDTIHQQATNNPLAVHSYGVLQDVADSIDKGKDTPDDLRLATETIKLHGVDINPQLQEAQSTIQAPEEESLY